jgi:ubiquinone/menaquinone biosynthesis C-methylase UbiE
MPAAYDTYDYPAYWYGRRYEHESEILAIKHFLQKIKRVESILEIGAGYGRLTSSYLFRGKKIILSDPSAKLLGIARKKNKSKKVRFIQSKLENLSGKVRASSCDMVIMVRVLHHIEDIDNTFRVVSRILKDRGYFILEFPNKRHFKATFSEFTKGNFTFPIDIFPKDIRCAKNLKKNTLPFINYHPDHITRRLESNNFEIIEKLSVSNLRSPLFKRIMPMEFLLFLDQFFYRLFSFFNFGPSIFILARKKPTI